MVEHLVDVAAEGSVVDETISKPVLVQELVDLSVVETEIKSAEAGTELNSK